MNEEWRAVPGFEGLYEVSDLGRVRRVGGRVLALKRAGRGYRSVARSAGGVISYRYVHRTVLAAFVGPCPAGNEGCHNDGDRENNRRANLRYDTPAANQADRRKHGTDQLGENNACAKLTEADVIQIRRLVQGRTHGQVAGLFGVDRGTVSKIARRERWSHV